MLGGNSTYAAPASPFRSDPQFFMLVDGQEKCDVEVKLKKPNQHF